MEIVKLDVKHQITISRDVLAALELKPGDSVVVELHGGKATISRLDDDDDAEPSPEEWEAILRVSMPEWFSPEDDEAFGDL